VEDHLLATKSSPRRRILNIGHFSELIKTRENVLKLAGYSVESTCSSPEAIGWFLARRFHLILVGHGIDFEERKMLIARLRSCDPFVPIVFVSGATLVEDESSADISVSSYPSELLEGVRQALQRSKVSR
jgi:DNA-binding response OmpR family regulator